MLFNSTIFSLHIASMALSSPLYTITNQHASIPHILFAKTHFSYFLESVLASYSNKIDILYTSSIFSHMLSTPLKFESVYDCGINSDKTQILPALIEDKTIQNTDFDSNWGDKRAYFISECGNVNISLCKFINCYSSTDGGGSIRICLDVIVSIRSTEFTRSHTSKEKGAAIYACQTPGSDYNEKNELLIGDTKLPVLNVEYCCFSECYPEKDEKHHGVALYSAASSTVLMFTSAVNCPGNNVASVKARGAQFDMQADMIKSKNVNITGGRSLYCAGMEYRGANYGCFKFQTFSKISICMFTSSLTDVDMKNIDFSFSNYDDINLRRVAGTEDVNLFSGVIHVRFLDIEDKAFERKYVTFKYFCFTNIKDQDGTGKIVSRGTTWEPHIKDADKQNYEQDISITFEQCSADQSVTGKTGQLTLNNTYNPTSKMLFLDIKIDNNIATNEIQQLSHGVCEGDVTPPKGYEMENVIESTDPFTSSRAYTFSNFFSISNAFSKTGAFSESNNFTMSDDFTKTTGFSYSTYFTRSGSFSNSIAFTMSDDFTKTTGFSYSTYFTQSRSFSNSIAFSMSDDFTKTTGFSYSTYFTQSGSFSNSIAFTKSDGFEKTSEFSQTSKFTKTKGFSETIEFTETSKFTQSNDFSQTTGFSYSMYFTKSDNFPKTFEFTFSFYFSNSIQFTKTGAFSKTGYFSKSDLFSLSTAFTESHSFTASNDFNATRTFTPSNTFTKSDEFTVSNAFTKSGEFSKSNAFSETNGFTETVKFSISNNFTKSSVFTNSDKFKPTKKFDSTSYFTSSDKFTRTHKFSQSSDFSKSDLFTKSDVFKQVVTSMIEKSEVIIDIKIDTDSNERNISLGSKIGIGVGVAAAVAVIALVGLFFLRKRKTKIEEFSEETLQVHEDTNSIMIHQNPLINLMSDDDPFEDEFIQ